MKKDNQIVIIGGTACGPKTAARARRMDPHARITIVEQQKGISAATCGFPYYISGYIKNQSSLFVRGPDYFKNVLDVDVLLGTKALKINRKVHTVEIANLANQQTSTLKYDKLVLATGCSPVIPTIQGKQLGGIFTLQHIDDATKIHQYVNQYQIKNAAIIGAGFIGLEMAETFTTLGVHTTVVEALGHVLPAFYDFEVAAYLEKYLRDKGIELYLNQRVTGFEGDKNDRVNKVVMDDGSIDTEIVLLATGTKPNIELARDAGLSIGLKGGILVNKRLQTSDPDIYAGGDCIENIHLVTGKNVLVPLGSTANKHGRVIGTNITGGKDTFPGVMGTSIAKVFDYNVGRIGLTERESIGAGYSVLTSLVIANDHANYYPGHKELFVKLIANKSNNKVLGAQIIGMGNTDKRIDVLVTVMSLGGTIDDLANLDLAYAPPYNGPFDPLHHAANVIRNKKEGIAKSVTLSEVKNRLDRRDNFILLDVRSQAEWNESHIEANQTKLIPLDTLRKNIGDIPKNSEIVVICRTSVRAYLAQRIMEGLGFTNVRFIDGSLAAWPYQQIVLKKNVQ